MFTRAVLLVLKTAEQNNDILQIKANVYNDLSMLFISIIACDWYFLPSQQLIITTSMNISQTHSSGENRFHLASLPNIYFLK